MASNLDETELARLEALAIESQRRYVPRFVYDACNAVPALVAEVRRLREKVEAWEWFGECFDNCKQRGKLPLEVHKTPSAYSEAWASLWAAREAVHADRE